LIPDNPEDRVCVVAGQADLALDGDTPFYERRAEGTVPEPGEGRDARRREEKDPGVSAESRVPGERDEIGVVARAVDPRAQAHEIVVGNLGEPRVVEPEEIGSARAGHGGGHAPGVPVVERLVHDYGPHAHHQTGTRTIGAKR
jgi:hypothetical protein